MEITYSSTPETRKPWKVVLVISAITVGCYLLWCHYNNYSDEADDNE